MIRGPVEYVPPVEIEVARKQTAMPLDENEGIYVRNIRTGKVRIVTGVTYMLNQDEELWEKVLPPPVEALLMGELDPVADRGCRGIEGSPAATSRDKTKVITFRVPHNAVVQIYDYKEKKARYASPCLELRAFLVALLPEWCRQTFFLFMILLYICTLCGI